ncbi:hypothetical protein RN88_08445 [Streptococcus intermedius]|nr:hypothetical protein RN88_08445 [Streptococcus intermedius]ARC26795.1 acetyltransferase [Streptococcus intermedius]RSJ19240.1 UDP-N-acetylbacillosamine N-acetyltransferase [Streptococcus intermedius]
MKLNKLVILGAGGHAKVCYDIACLMGKWKKIVFLDDNLNSDWADIQGKIEEYPNYIKDSMFFVAIGNNKLRETLTEELLQHNAKLVKLTHPSAIISPNVSIGDGTVIMPACVINAGSIIKQGCIINSGVIIEHDSYIDEFVHLSPSVILSGTCKVGKSTWLGTGTLVKNNITIVGNVMCGVGSVVIKNIEKSGIYYGVPVREKREKK